ncbi:MAG TPA: hypothetical protein V6C82_08435 [Chroococcales cyanobacterium]|jgi:hypothetical protein
MKKLFLLTLSAALLLTGCAGGNERVKGSTRVVEASASERPDWLEKRSLEDSKDIVFVGAVQGVRDLGLGEEQAEYQAKKVIASSIREVFQGEFNSATEGTNRLLDRESSLGQAIQSAISGITDRVQVRGVLPVERYWQRTETVIDDGVANGYNVWLKVKINKADYDRAKNQAYQDLANVEQIKSDAKAKELLEKVRAKLE